MHQDDMESRIRNAVEHVAPDPLENILSSRGSQENAVRPAAEKRVRKKTHWTSLAAAAVLALICCGGFAAWQNASAVASVISLDVNPSIQLRVNAREKVLSADPMNEDAEVILENMELKGSQLNVAVNAIVGSLLQHGYLDRISSAILISVEDSDAQRASRLENSLMDQVNATLQNASSGAEILSQVVERTDGLEDKAAASGISVGKAALVEQVQTCNSSLDFDGLSALSVAELRQLQSAGAPAMPIGQDAAFSSALAQAGLSAADVLSCEVDPELDETPPHYEVELKTASGKWEFDVDAYTGAILNGSAATAQETRPASPSSAGSIGEAAAKRAALDHAGITDESSLKYINCWLEYDNGQPHHYQVEFQTRTARYEYEIDLTTGAVLDAETEQTASSSGPASSPSPAPSSLPSAAGRIGVETAQSIALSDAGLSASDVTGLKVELDREGGTEIYDVEFRTSGVEYDYELRASDGAILKSDWEAGKTSSTTAVSADVGAEAAKSAAFLDAGVSAESVTHLKIEADTKKGTAVYKIEFKVSDTEYEYEIRASDGAVLSRDTDH